eukprot:jgi/Galph1/5237/GphlegSOOS_G3802.1
MKILSFLRVTEDSLTQIPPIYAVLLSEISEVSSFSSESEGDSCSSVPFPEHVKTSSENVVAPSVIVPVAPVSPIVSRCPTPVAQFGDEQTLFLDERNTVVIKDTVADQGSNQTKKQIKKALRSVISSVQRVPGGTPIEEVLLGCVRQGEVEAFYLVDLGSVIMKYFEFTRQLSRVVPHFAVKCNPDTEVIRVLASLGCNFDCASKAEIDLVQSCGVTGDRIIYANPCKPESHIKHAVQHGVNLVTFDNKDELLKISLVCSKVRAVLRIATEDHDSLCPLSTKFGALPDEVLDLLLLAKDLNVFIEGVAFHVGSGCRSVQTYIRSLYEARRIFDVAKSLGLEPFTLLDIGGGFPGYDGESPITFYEICSGIRDTLDLLFPPNQVHVIAEPGRYFVSAGFTLAARVIARRFRSRIEQVGGSEGSDRESFGQTELVADYYIDDGVYGSFRDVVSLGLTFHPKCLSVSLNSECNCRTVRSTVFGPTCDSIDCIVRNYPLPILTIGDWLYFTNMGAYTVSLASTFNGFTCPSVRYICAL